MSRDHHETSAVEDIAKDRSQKISGVQLSTRAFACVVVGGFFLVCSLARADELTPQPRLFVSHQSKASLATLSPFDVVVLDAHCAVESSPRKAQQVFARLDVKAALASGTEAAALLVEKQIAPLLARGFNGVALDGTEAFGKAATASLLGEFSKRFPDASALLCNPPADCDPLLGTKCGVLFEGVTTARDVAAAVDGSRAERVKQLTARKVAVHAVEFAASGANDRNQQLADAAAALGAIPFVTTREMNGASLAPLRDQSRRVLVLFGWDAKEEEKPSTWPTDTMTADLLQAPLEWLGYEADYLDIGKAPLPADAAARYAAIILDADLNVPLGKETGTAQWLLAAKSAGLPVLFMGGIPFSSDEAKRALAEGLGLKGTLEPVQKVVNPTIVRAESTIVNAETRVVARNSDFHDLAAPDKSQVLLSLQGRGADGALVRFDPVFLTSWGGMWLEPYVVFRGSADSNLFYADPYRILAGLLSKRGVIPAPDATTRDGRRIFYSHIDGDGFASESDFKGHPICGELVRDRILKSFPFPVTVSVIEADMRALAEGLDDKDRDKIVATAKSIFELPNVQVASHSFSHPYQWDKDDPNPGIYDEPNMPLKPAAEYPAIDPEREIRGSIDFINQTLAPKGKRVELMLWSGNCRPGTRALRVCREMGVENMNGGNTIVSRLYPGIAGIAPRVMPWDDELQIHAANQNEFMYANGWQGPFFGGFADVVDTFERTEAGRRTKPVNVYYHFYSATSLSSLRALEKIHRWCAGQPLHSITALQYAHIVKDAWRTKVYEIAPRHWLVANQGDLRTLRLPKYLGHPDMARCKGVSGYIEHEDSIYIHTLGERATEIVLTDAADGPATADTARLRLASCSAEIDFSTFDPLKVAFSVADLRPVQADFTGLQPNAACEVTIDSSMSRMTADETGTLKLSLPATAKVILDATRSRYALAR